MPSNKLKKSHKTGKTAKAKTEVKCCKKSLFSKAIPSCHGQMFPLAKSTDISNLVLTSVTAC